MSGWPLRHPVFADPALSPYAAAAQAAAPDGRVLKVLRHVPGHRVTSLVEVAGHRLVVKVHARPVATGTDEFLRMLARAGLGDVAPYPRAVDAGGHVAALTFHPGTLLHELDDRHLVGACVRVGATLRKLHDCRAAIGRRWTDADEIGRAQVGSGPDLDAAVAAHAGRGAGLPEPEYVVSHRHCRPGHLVVDGGGSVRLVDFGAVSLAPRGLDLGNLLAHLHRDGLRGVRRPAVVWAAADAFLLGYGPGSGLDQRTVSWWTSLSLLRLAGLAQLRRRDRVEANLLLAAVAGSGGSVGHSLATSA